MNTRIKEKLLTRYPFLRKIKGNIFCLENYPWIKTLSLFLYDAKRFARYSGAFRQKNRSSKMYKMMMDYHILEKGLTMPGRRQNFGHGAVLTLIKDIREYRKSFGEESAQLTYAVGLLKTYEAIHSEDEKKEYPDFWRHLQDFLLEYPQTPAVKLTHYTRNTFWENSKNRDFYQFAHSRHSVRNFSGTVSVDRIKQAVDLAQTAPSACNRQYVKVLCISNDSLCRRICGLQNGNRGFGHLADKILVVVGSLEGMRWAEERSDLYTNIGIFLMNLSYSLHYFQIAHCILNWSVTPGNDKEIHRLLNLGQSSVIGALIACGDLPDEIDLFDSPRKNLEEVFKEIK